MPCRGHHTTCHILPGHGGTTQVDFEVDCQPPADSLPGKYSIIMVKQTVKKTNKKMKEVWNLFVFSGWSECNESVIDWESTCGFFKRASTVVEGIPEWGIT